MKYSNYLFATMLALCLAAMAQAQFFPQTGSFGYALNSSRHVFDLSPDNKIGIVLTNDSSTTKVRLSTFDPLLGTTFDSTTFGFGPLEVNLAQTPNGLRAFVLTSEGGPRKIWLFDVSATGKLTAVTSNQLTSSNADQGSGLSLSAGSQVGFLIVASATPGGNDLVCFNLSDGSVVSRTPVSGVGNAFTMKEAGGKRTLAFMKDTITVELFDATNPALPSKITDIGLHSNGNSSGLIVSGGLAFSGDGRYVFASSQFADFSVIDTTTLQVISSIANASARFYRVRVYEDAQRRLLAVQGTISGAAAIILLDATDPFHLATLGQGNSLGNLGPKGDIAFSQDGSRLYVLSADGLSAYDLPSFTRLWQQLVNPGQANENQLIVFGPPEHLLGAWGLANGSPNSAVIGSFGANLPNISSSNISVTEPDTGSVNANFTVVLSPPSAQRVTVNYVTVGASAQRLIDFTDVSGTVTFEPGETSKTISVPVLGDTIDETDETFNLFLQNAVGGSVTTPQLTCTILDNDAPPTLTVSDVTSIEGNSGTRNLTFTVQLSSQTSRQVSFDYATSDQTATAGVDYTPRSGTINFLTNQMSVNIDVTINGDTSIEPDETLQLTISNPQNASIARATATGTIISDDSATGNPLDLTGFFVRQHYLDFLAREPDADGFNFWVNNIDKCGSDATCRDIQRINTSGAFFQSIEFQQTGYFVERMYKAAYGDDTGSSTLGSPHQLAVPIVRRNQFLSDTAMIGAGVVVLQPGWEQVLESHKQNYAFNFTVQSRFVNEYPNNMTAADFVDKLNLRAGNPLSTAERNQLVSDLSTNTRTRAQVLRAVAEHPNLVSAETNRAFVLMQYFGYLRRNPNDAPDTDYTGYDFWLTKLNQFNGNYVAAEMVKAFLGSTEYRKRFGT